MNKHQTIQVAIQYDWTGRSDTFETTSVRFMDDYLSDDKHARIMLEATNDAMTRSERDLVRQLVDNDGCWITESSDLSQESWSRALADKGDEILALVSYVYDQVWPRVTAEQIMAAIAGVELRNGYMLRTWEQVTA